MAWAVLKVNTPTYINLSLGYNSLYRNSIRPMLPKVSQSRLAGARTSSPVDKEVYLQYKAQIASGLVYQINNVLIHHFVEDENFRNQVLESVPAGTGRSPRSDKSETSTRSTIQMDPKLYERYQALVNRETIKPVNNALLMRYINDRELREQIGVQIGRSIVKLDTTDNGEPLSAGG